MADGSRAKQPMHPQMGHCGPPVHIDRVRSRASWSGLTVMLRCLSLSESDKTRALLGSAVEGGEQWFGLLR